MVSVHAPAEHYQSPIVRYGLRLFAAFLMVAGLVLIVPLTRSIIDARASTSWPTTQGTVSESTVEESTGAKKSYTPSVRYDYVVNGQRYSNQAISFRDLGDADRGEAEAITTRYPVSSTVTVHHSPADPQTSVLEPGAPPRVYLTALVSPGMIVLGVIAWRANKRQGAPAAAENSR